MKTSLTFTALAMLTGASLYAGQPGLVSLRPASQTITGPTQTTYTFTVSDTDGPSDLAGFDALFGYSYECWFWYDRANNRISVEYNNNWTDSPVGSGGTSLTGQACTVDAAHAAVSTSGNNLTLSVPITLGSSASANGSTEPIWMDASNNAGADTGYQQMGSWTSQGSGGSAFFSISVSPSNIFLKPDSSQTVTVTVTDQPGFSGTVNLSLSAFPNGARMTGTFSPASITGSGTSTLTIATDSLTPPHNATLTVTGSTAAPEGTITEQAMFHYAVTNGPPTFSPPSQTYTGNQQTIMFSVADASKSVSEIIGSNVLINSTLDGRNACWVWYNAGYIWLANDDASSWSGMAMNGGNVLQNSQCEIYGPGSKATGDETTDGNLFMQIAIIRTAAFSGTKNIYVRAPNNSGYDSGYQLLGTWTAP